MAHGCVEPLLESRSEAIPHGGVTLFVALVT
jgi:hypothetical protein